MLPHISLLLDPRTEDRKLKLTLILCALKLVIKNAPFVSFIHRCVQLNTALRKHQCLHNHLSCWEIVVTMTWTQRCHTGYAYMGNILRT